jgi:ATP-binding cassette subfamily C protein CydC
VIGRLVGAALLGALTDLAGLALLGTATWLLVTAAGHPPFGALSLAIVAVRALAVGKGAGRYLERLAGHDVALRVLARLRTRAYAALVRPRERAGDLLTRLVSDVDGVQDALLRCALPVAVAVLVAGGAVGFVGVGSPVAAGVLGGGLVLAAGVLPAVAYAVDRTVSGDALAVATVDVLHGAPDLIAYGAARPALERARRAARTVAAGERRIAPSLLAGAGALLPGLAALGVLRVSGSAVLAVVALGAVEAVAPVRDAAGRWAGVRRSLRRVRDLLADAPPAAAYAAEPAGPLTATLRGAVVRYPGRTGPALDGVDLDLAPGRRVAVVGPSGCGKSTLLGVLTGEVPLAGGRLLLNGVDAATLDPSARWRLVGGVLAGAHVFHASLRENVTLGRPGLSTIDTVLAAAGLPDVDLDASAGEDGGALSGGQRQRLVLARALAAAPPLLVLDEPTEGLDPSAADAVLTAVLRAAGERGVLLVTHRLAGLDAFDEILVLDAGRVLTRGHHDDLRRRSGWYADAWQAQRLAERGYADLVGAGG